MISSCPTASHGKFLLDKQPSRTPPSARRFSTRDSSRLNPEWQTRLGKTHGGIPAYDVRFAAAFFRQLSSGVFLHVVPTNTAPQRSAELKLNHMFVSRVGGKLIRPFVGRGHAQFEVSPHDPVGK
ncbi:hypothetical protein FB45DRAFT_1036990 [Roridomyces roridus]|uniref:Uncharacterized protein n=1 Tax=Roridomyces roridus TaxID=1738132 RepID=A0AAD7FDT3_9AGAR|nr:hypothetical protein FB45DRAFT_1036990 [Roridomyces roridus]